MTNKIANLFRLITLITVIAGQLLYPFYAYAGLLSAAKAVILSGPSSAAGKMVGNLLTKTIAGNPAIGIALTMNDAGDPNYDCMVAINPACLPLPSNWHRDPQTAAPVPPSSAARENYYWIDPGDATGTKRLYGSAACSAFNAWFSSTDAQGNPYYRVRCEQAIIFVNETPWGGTMDPTKEGCPAGYSLQNDACNLTDITQVLKPNTPCSIVRSGDTFSFDNRNPACNAQTNGQYILPSGQVFDASNGNVIIYPTLDDAKNKNPAASVEPATGGGTIVRQYDAATNTTTTAIIKDGKVVATGTEVGNTTKPGSGTGTGAGGAPITCHQVGTCGVSQEATQKNVEANTKAISLSMNQIASGLAMGEPIPGITPGDYAGAVDQFHNMMPKPDDYRGPVNTMLKAMGFPESGGGQCSLTRTVTLFGRSVTIQFVPNGICGPYQQVANWVTWGLVAIIAWQQVKSLAGDKSDLNKG